jgi:hypothetical protein
MAMRKHALALLLLLPASLLAQTNTRPTVTIANQAAQLRIDENGGSIVHFSLKGHDLNPLVWSNSAPGMEPRPMSHFLCLDRWGQTSEAEGKSGMPFHGEATRVKWNVARSTATDEALMSASLPLAGLNIQRTATIDGTQALVRIRESVTNRNKLGRVYNMVQHPTIGPPFLDRSVVVDSNARRGFMQSSPMPNPEEPSVYWPQALKDGQPVNLRHLTDDPLPNVVSFVIEDELGWVTAANAAKGLLIGYVWQTSEYPWLNIWRHVADGEPLARGLEFGTTGLHQPFQTLVKKGSIFGRPVLSWLEPNETHTRSYAMFLFRIPNDFRGVASLQHRDGKLVLRERDSQRELSMPAARLF